MQFGKKYLFHHKHCVNITLLSNTQVSLSRNPHSTSPSLVTLTGFTVNGIEPFLFIPGWFNEWSL